MEITKVTITLANEGQLRAFASITLDHSYVIRHLRIIEGPNGLFLAVPQLNREKGTRLDITQPMRPQLRKLFEARILAEYRSVIGDDIARCVVCGV
jgi:stage V sporulation protein G